MQVTQKDIARRLGVSVSLVSRALGGKAEGMGVRRATVERILRTAAELDYVPSDAARALKGLPGRTLGVVVFDFDDPFFNPLIAQLQHAAHGLGYSLALAGFERRRVALRDLEPLLKHRLDGLIVAGSGPAGAWLRPFLRRGLPVVRIGGGGRVSGLAAVRVDGAAGVEMLLDHLTALGHCRIGFAGADIDAHRDRHAQWCAGLRRRGLPCRAEWAAFGRGAVSEAGYGVGRAWARARRPDGPTALVASSDIVALGALRALHEAGLRVPQDVSLTGFDDIPAARLAIPSLTTVRQPVAEMVAAALACVTRAGGTGGGPDPFRPELVVRESTAAPAAGGAAGRNIQ